RFSPSYPRPEIRRANFDPPRGEGESKFFASVAFEAAGGHGDNRAGAHHPGMEAEARQRIDVSAVEHVEAAGIGAEGGHDHPRAVRSEAAAAETAAAHANRRTRMKMAGDLSCRRRGLRLMTEGERADAQFFHDGAAESAGRDGVV